MTHNIVFDFGAVLFQWQPHALLQEFCPAMVRSPEQAQSLAHAMFQHPDWHEFDRGISTPEQVAAQVSARLGLPHEALIRMMDCIAERLVPLPDSVALLAELVQRRRDVADVRLYYLSNMPTPYARFLDRTHEFLAWFDGGMYSSDVQCIKPDPGIYQALMQRHNLMAADTVFIDDLPANVQAAQALGWRGIVFGCAEQVKGDLRSFGVL